MGRTAAAWAGLLLLTSCAGLGPGSPDRPDLEAVLRAAGADSDLATTAGFVARSVTSVQRANEDLTPVQEYLLGRSFGATLLQTRRPYDNVAATRYLNLIGRNLARFSARPETYAGYRFLILDSPEVNAFAAPGGFIFVTRGLLRLTKSEAEVAAVLAHEVAHVEQEHGLKAIRKERLSAAVLGIGADALQTYGSSEVRAVTAALADSVSDLTKTIINNGYSRETEFEADKAAVRILRDTGYPPQALLTMLGSLKKLPRDGEGGFSRTHPQPDARLAQVRRLVPGPVGLPWAPAQDSRFHAALDGL